MISFSKSLVSKKLDKGSVVDDKSFWFGKDVGTDQKGAYVERVSPIRLSFQQMDNIYVADVWIRAIIDKIVDRVVNIQPLIKPVSSAIDEDTKKVKDETKKNIDMLNEFLIEPNDVNEGFSSIRKKCLRDILKYDAAAIEIVKGLTTAKNNPIVKLYSVAGDSIKLNPDKRGLFTTDRAYVQIDKSMKEITSWKKDELIYFMANPQAGRVYGLSPIESLAKTIEGDLNAAQYNLDFYNNNATPRIAVLMKGLGLGQGNAAMKRFRQWWNDELEGKPHKPIIIGTDAGEVSIEKLNMTNEDMQFIDYSWWLLGKIMVIYKMQPTVLGIADKNSKQGDSEYQLEQFKIDAVMPQLTLFAERFNRMVIFAKEVFNMKDVYLDFDLELGDKKSQAEYLERYMRNGVITINEIRTSILGLTTVPWGDVPYLQNNIAPFGIARDGKTSAVPMIDEDGNTVTVPNLATASKSYIKKYLSKDDMPVGWENKSVSERLEIVNKLLVMKEQMLSKVYIIPDGK